VLVLRRGGELGGVVGCSLRGGGGMGKKKENRGRECQQSGYILTFTDGITDGKFLSVYPSVISPVNVPCHCTEIPV
jgi:hypothetical protein